MSERENSNKMLTELVTETRNILNKQDINPDSTLTEIGIDSLNVIELIIICEQIYTNIANPEQLAFDEYTTLQDLHKQLLDLSINA